MERTKHLFYECPLAQNIWSIIIADFNEQATEDAPLSIPIQLSCNMIMFNQVPQSLTYSEKIDLIDFIMTTKHRRYNLQRIPSHREVTLSTALDIDKVIIIRQFSFIDKFNNKLKARVGLL